MDEQNNLQVNKPAPNPPNNIFLPVIFSVIITAIVVGGGVYAWQKYSSQIIKQNLEQQIVSLQDQIDQLHDVDANQQESMATPNKDSENEIKYPTLISIDDNWNLYVNQDLGFSLKVPVGGEGENKVEIKEEGDIVWIAMLGNSSYADWNELFSNANLSDYERARGSWKILIKTVRNNDELDSFIKNRYGSTCALGEATATNQLGVYDVDIDKTNFIIGDDSTCFVNYVVRIKYFPEKNLVAAWDLGQAPNFFVEGVDCADCEMEDSFQFID